LDKNNDKITNVTEVLWHMKARFDTPSSTRELRIFAEQEIAKGVSLMYKNVTSAQKTIHDACARRLRPDIQNIKEFDNLISEWRFNKNKKLERIIQKHSQQAISRLFK
jgi:hypothetical protein